VLHGDLTPECAAIVAAVLDALSAPAGAEDTRTHAQRYPARGDALARKMHRDVCHAKAIRVWYVRSPPPWGMPTMFPTTLPLRKPTAKD
jgi:hypothetical protein